jgi:hypothetical protein
LPKGLTELASSSNADSDRYTTWSRWHVRRKHWVHPCSPWSERVCWEEGTFLWRFWEFECLYIECALNLC